MKRDTLYKEYMESVKLALMNAAMMNNKLNEFQAALDLLMYAKNFFSPEDNKNKINFRTAVR